jgi:drug/metabolite transporter (DMT)-like permease
MQAVALVLVYAVLMSIWWLLMKVLSNMKTIQDGAEVLFPNNLMRFSSGMGASTLIGWSCLQRGGISHLWQLSSRFWMTWSVVAVLNIILAYLYLKAVEKSVLSTAVHVTLFSPIVAIFTSYLFGVDPIPNAIILVGIGAVLFGVYLLHFNPSTFGWNVGGPFLDIWRHRNKWLWYTLGIAVCGGIAIPLDKRCVQLSDYALAPGLTLFVAWGLAFGIAALRAGDFQKLNSFNPVRSYTGLLGIALAFGVANGFQAAAYQYQFAAAVASLKRLDAPFTVVWALTLLSHQEKAAGHPAFRMIGSLVAFLGALLIGFSKTLS